MKTKIEYCKHCGSTGDVICGEVWFECLACGTFEGYDSIGNHYMASVSVDDEELKQFKSILKKYIESK
jgi:hypothetical protein